MTIHRLQCSQYLTDYCHVDHFNVGVALAITEVDQLLPPSEVLPEVVEVALGEELAEVL